MLRDILLIFLGFFLGYFIDWVWARTVRGLHLQKKNYYKIIFKSYRIHHNILGYIFIILGLFIYTYFLISVGIGIIIGHRIRDRLLWFIEKV